MKSNKSEKNSALLNQYAFCKPLIYYIEWSREESLALAEIFTSAVQCVARRNTG
jgi:hypothetical protein